MGTSSMNRVDGGRVGDALRAGHPAILVEVDVEYVGLHAGTAGERLMADLDVDPAAVGRRVHSPLELVLPAIVGAGLPAISGGRRGGEPG